MAATGIAADRWAEHFDTVSVCFSKGLGAPVGSALAGPRETIDRGPAPPQAVRRRHAPGGHHRRGALYALEHHRDRLAEDHENAQRLARAIRETEGLELCPERVDTNIVIFDVAPALGSARAFVAALRDRGVLMLPIGPTQVRAVTHLDAGRADVERAAAAIGPVAASLSGGGPSSS